MKIERKKAVATVETTVTLNVYDKVAIAQLIADIEDQTDAVSADRVIVPKCIMDKVNILLRNLAGNVYNMVSTNVFEKMYEDKANEERQ